MTKARRTPGSVLLTTCSMDVSHLPLIDDTSNLPLAIIESMSALRPMVPTMTTPSLSVGTESCETAGAISVTRFMSPPRSPTTRTTPA